MNLPRPSGQVPFFLPGSRGRLFAIYYPPPPGVRETSNIVLAPAFAEEMNRCRAMVAMQCRLLASVGIGTLVVDLFGTGDSGGDFVDGTWSQWKDDLAKALQWLRSEGHACTTLWGIRLGALLAFDFAQDDGEIDRLLFWQPVTSGKSFLTQFLRIRIAAELGEPSGVRTTDELREQFAGGSSVEVSGYEISPRLGLDLDEKSFSTISPRREMSVDWFEVPSTASGGVSRASATAIAYCRERGLSVRTFEVPGPPFWQLHERTLAPDLISATTALFGKGATS